MSVCRFFAGYRVRPDGIHFVMHADGRPSGMAFVEFDCPQEAMRALVSTRSLHVRSNLTNYRADDLLRGHPVVSLVHQMLLT